MKKMGIPENVQEAVDVLLERYAASDIHGFPGARFRSEEFVVMVAPAVNSKHRAYFVCAGKHLAGLGYFPARDLRVFQGKVVCERCYACGLVEAVEFDLNKEGHEYGLPIYPWDALPGITTEMLAL